MFAAKKISFHQQVVIWLDICYNSSNFARRSEGHFSKGMGFAPSRNSAELGGKASASNGFSFRIAVRTLNAKACLGNVVGQLFAIC